MRYAILARRYDVEAPLGLAIARAMAPRGLEISAFVEEDVPPAPEVEVALREVGLPLPGERPQPLASAEGAFATVILLDPLELPEAFEGAETVNVRLRGAAQTRLAAARQLREELRLVLAEVFRRRREADEDPRAAAQRRARMAPSG